MENVGQPKDKRRRMLMLTVRPMDRVGPRSLGTNGQPKLQGQSVDET